MLLLLLLYSQLSERANLGAQALEALSNGQPVSDQLTIDIIAAAVRSVVVHFYHTFTYLSSGRLNGSHYRSCPSVRTAWKTGKQKKQDKKNRRKAKLGVNVHRVSSNRCANFQLNRPKVSVRVRAGVNHRVSVVQCSGRVYTHS